MNPKYKNKNQENDDTFFKKNQNYGSKHWRPNLKYQQILKWREKLKKIKFIKESKTKNKKKVNL
jgi:hypothetical protein